MSAWRACLLLGALGVLGYLALPDGAVQDVAYVVFGLLSAGLILLGVRRNAPGTPWAWRTMAAAQALWSVADLVYNGYDLTTEVVPSPNWADALYLLGYVPLLVGLVLLQRRTRPPNEPLGAMLDAAVVTAGAGLLAWVFLVLPTVATVPSGPAAVATAAAYPLVDVLVVGALALVGATATRDVVSTGWFRLLAAAVVVLLVTDGVARVQTLSGNYSTGDLLDAGWLASYVLWAAAALHPSVGAAHERPRREQLVAGGVTVGRLGVLTAAVLCAPVTLVLQETLGRASAAVWPVVGCTALLFLLLVARLGGLALRSQHSARTDHLTGVANRRWFTDVLEEAVAPGGLPCSLLLVDLDRFKDVNDTFGHGTGDVVIREVGARLRAAAHRGDVAARVGGDEFAVLLAGVGEPAAAVARARELRAALTRPVVAGELTLLVEASVGVACAGPHAPPPPAAPGPGADTSPAADLLRRADLALYAAKADPDGVLAHTAELDRLDGERIALLGELHEAVGTDELRLHFQPQLELATGRVVGCEALLRWEHPRLGLLSPDAFLPAAEQTGLMQPLTRQVLALALAECARWRAAGRDLRVAVNLSVHNLHDQSLLATVADALAATGVPATALTCEITETSVMTDPERALRTVTGLARTGVRIGVDDYGTGHSSLAYLQRLPVRELKLDKSFVTGMAEDEAGAAIVRSTVELARHLRLDVVAEGVEDAAVLAELRSTGCWAVQGFHVGRPVPPAEVLDLVDAVEARWRTTRPRVEAAR